MNEKDYETLETNTKKLTSLSSKRCTGISGISRPNLLKQELFMDPITRTMLRAGIEIDYHDSSNSLTPLESPSHLLRVSKQIFVGKKKYEVLTIWNNLSHWTKQS